MNALKWTFRAMFSMALVLALGASAQAAPTVWLRTFGDWGTDTNWTAGVPTDANDAQFKDVPASSLDGVAGSPNVIDLHGTNGFANNIEFWGVSYMTIQGDAGVSLTVTNDILLTTDKGGTGGSSNNNCADEVFDIDMIVGGTIQQYRKCRAPTFNRNLTVTGAVKTKSGTWTFGDGVGSDTFTFTGGLDVTFENVNQGSTVETNINGILNTSTVTIGAAGTLNVLSADALGTSSTNVTVNAGGKLKIQAVQTSLANITVDAYGLLTGDLTGAVYNGDTPNVTLMDDAILAATAGGPNPGDVTAAIWVGAIDAASGPYNDDQPAYKGIAIGAFTNAGAQWANTMTYQAPASYGDLDILVANNGVVAYAGAHLYVSDAGATANITFASGTGVSFTSATGANSTFNGDTLEAGEAAEFNIHNKSVTSTAILAFSNGKIASYQKYHVYDGIVTFNAASMGALAGVLDLQSGSMLQATAGGFFNGSTNTQIIFNEGSVLRLQSTDLFAFDNGTMAGKVVVNGTPVISLANPDATYNFNSTLFPVLTDLILKSNLAIAASNNNLMTLGGDLTIGNGKFIFDWNNNKGCHVIGNGTTKILAEDGADMIGFACLAPPANNDYIDIIAPVDAKNATIQVGTTTPLTFSSNSNVRTTNTGVGIIRLSGPISNTPEVQVVSGYLWVYANEMDDAASPANPLNVGIYSGATFAARGTVPGNCKNPLYVSGAVVADLDLSNTDLTVHAGGYANFQPTNTTIHNLAVEEKFVSGSAGVRVDETTDVLTVSGTLSGNGGWGGDGTMMVAGTIAPGASIGGLTGGNLEMAEGSKYEWQLRNPNGDPGIDYDVIDANSITFEGAWTLKILEDSLEGAVEGKSFTIATAVNFVGFDAGSVTIERPTDWSGGTLAVVGTELVLSGLSTGPIIVPGDTNSDGVVDAADFITLKKNFGAGAGGGVAVGNFDGIGTVDWADLNILTGNMGFGGPAPATTPEPATMGLLAIGALAVVRRRRS
jgi:hypothetical protein